MTKKTIKGCVVVIKVNPKLRGWNRDGELTVKKGRKIIWQTSLEMDQLPRTLPA